MLASLNHPNIAAIHGIEEDEVEGHRALVLDFGLAKALDSSPTGDPSQSPTLTAGG